MQAYADTCPPAADTASYSQCLEQMESGHKAAIISPNSSAIGLYQWMGDLAKDLKVCTSDTWNGCNFDGEFVQKWNKDNPTQKITSLSCCPNAKTIETARACPTKSCNGAMLSNDGAGLAFQKALEAETLRQFDKEFANKKVTTGPYAGMSFDQLCGLVINGITITRETLYAMRHLKGPNGVQAFVDSNGKFNGADGNGTGIQSYGACMNQCIDHESAFNTCVAKFGPVSVCDQGDTENDNNSDDTDDGGGG